MSPPPAAAMPRSALAGRPQTAALGAQIDPIRLLRQNLRLLLLVAIGAGMLGAGLYLALNSLAPRYRASVFFELPPVVMGTEELMAVDSRNEDVVVRMAQTECGRLVSREVLTRAMRSRDIETTSWSRGFRDAADGFLIEDAVDDLARYLAASPVRNTLYFTLSWSAPDASDVPVVLNRIADTYMEARQAEENARFASDLQLLRQRDTDLGRQLTVLSNDIASFISQRNITALDERLDQGRIAIQNLSLRLNETRSMLSLLASRRNQTQAKLQGTLEPSSDDRRIAEADQEVIRISGQLRALRIQQSTARERFSSDHPSVRELDQMIRSTEGEREAAIDMIIQRNLTSDFRQITDQIESYRGLLENLDREYETQESRLKDLAADMAELEARKQRKDRLEQERIDVGRQMNELEQFRRRDAARKVTIAQRATTPREKSFPKWYLVMPLTVFVALGGTVGLLFAREFLDTRVKYASDVAAIGGGRVLGVVPERSDDPTAPARVELVVREQPSSVLAESLRQTANALQRSMEEGGIRSVLLLGGTPEAGTSSVASNLAASLAAGGRSVLLVDANLRRPRLGEIAGQSPGHAGLGDVLAGQAEIEAATVDCGGGLHLMPAGTEANRVVERLNTVAASTLLAELASRYDAVLVDTAPWVVAGDAQALTSKVDGTVLVVRAWQEQRGLVARVVGHLTGSKAVFLGIVLNRPRNTTGGYFRKNFEAMASYANRTSA
jgi:capsular exopolysaccharide synthesis family protein